MEEENVPLYTETDTDGLEAWIDALTPNQRSHLPLPITLWPYPTWHPSFSPPSPSESTVSLTQEEKDDIYTLQTRLINTLFAAVRSKNTEIVRLLVSRGWVSPDVPNDHGETPLIAAIDAGNGSMVCTLVSLGARVDGYGRYQEQERTPLMVAAQTGRLALVKLLMEDFKADDAVIAPDGQLALRLAADSGHREVVAYLPVRRGGEWRRWKVHHDVAVRRIRRAGVNIYKFFKFFLWDVPKFLVWTIPKHVVVKPVMKSCQWCWENKGRFGGWCKHQTKEFPGRVKRAGQAVWKGVKKVPKVMWTVAKEVPKEMWRVAKRVPVIAKNMVMSFWRFIKRIPGAMKFVGLWVWDCLKRAGIAVGNVFLKVVSAIHTAVMAVLGFFRSITFKDVWNGICAVFRAIFVEFPQAIWAGIQGAGRMALKVLEALFGCIGELIWYFFKGLIWIAKFVPTQLWKIICSIGGSIAKGYHEILVWFNPKH